VTTREDAARWLRIARSQYANGDDAGAAVSMLHMFRLVTEAEETTARAGQCVDPLMIVGCPGWCVS